MRACPQLPCSLPPTHPPTYPPTHDHPPTHPRSPTHPPRCCWRSCLALWGASPSASPCAGGATPPTHAPSAGWWRCTAGRWCRLCTEDWWRVSAGVCRRCFVVGEGERGARWRIAVQEERRTHPHPTPPHPHRSPPPPAHAGNTTRLLRNAGEPEARVPSAETYTPLLAGARITLGGAQRKQAIWSAVCEAAHSVGGACVAEGPPAWTVGCGHALPGLALPLPCPPLPRRHTRTTPLTPTRHTHMPLHTPPACMQVWCLTVPVASCCPR